VSPVNRERIKVSGRIAKQKRMARRKIEALESYLSGDSTVVPLLEGMGMREVNSTIAKIKLAQLSQRVQP
jgi:hypothetical protein